jgi:hypothetical protein
MPAMGNPLTSRLVPVLIALMLSSSAMGEEPAHPANGHCLDCHTCPNPKHSQPCLKGCTRSLPAGPVPAAATAVPDFFVIGELSQIYGTVLFPHRLHAEMEEMAQGCDICHHNNPEGRILACKECHGGPSNPEHLGQPGLKGAYHRQCLSCHREWSHATDCAVCHKPLEGGQVVSVTPEAADIMGRLHPNVAPPGRWVYETPEMTEGTFVTFRHKEHIDLFGLKCVECHKRENCSRCHGGESASPHTRSDPHEDCIKCHDVTDNCERCHVTAEIHGFSHESRTGFPLKPFHAKLQCSRCHGSSRQFAGLNRECSACHAEEWFPDSFDHSLTGLALDETHREGSCSDCHPTGLGKPVSCEGCHDDGRKPPESLPGKRL